MSAHGPNPSLSTMSLINFDLDPPVHCVVFLHVSNLYNYLCFGAVNIHCVTTGAALGKAVLLYDCLLEHSEKGVNRNDVNIVSARPA